MGRAAGTGAGRVMALTQAHLAKVARDVPECRLPYAFTPLSDTDFEEVAHRLLDEIGTAPFWIFAISSLIWKPAFEHVEARRSVAHGWRRSLCLEIKHRRATPDQPGRGRDRRAATGPIFP